MSSFAKLHKLVEGLGKAVVIGAFAMAIAGCEVGPRYKRPATSVP